MIAEEFRVAFAGEIADAVARLSRRYSVTDDELAAAFFGSVKKYLPESLSSPPANQDKASIGQFLASLNLDDLCLALACAKGDDDK